MPHCKTDLADEITIIHLVIYMYHFIYDGVILVVLFKQMYIHMGGWVVVCAC